ncbi:hybrid sensor histidine kinase/response regulator [Pseudorhodoferax sp. LjRoot39]|uniref:hybrid sensor histidine kinase/response regulator n=1 Tax=Pseudorhodoferax sp. LjRoot39 TaxID=3342328 RepID=UPI003ECE1431
MDNGHKTAAAGSADDLDELRLQTITEFSSKLRWQIFAAVLMIAAMGVVGGLPWPYPVAWAVAVTVAREWRLALFRRLVAQVERPVAERLRQAGWSTLLLGCLHGASAGFMFWMDTAESAILTMVSMSQAAGSASASYTIRPVSIGFQAGVVVPSALVWALQPHWWSWAIAALLLMLLGVQFRFSEQNRRVFEEAFRIRTQNTVLLEQLSHEREQLAEARDAAVRADLSKSRFLAAASHDLRQPMQSLALNSGTLTRMQLEGETRAIAQEISEGIEVLRQMLDGLLDISQLDAGAVRPHLQQIPLKRFLENVCERLRPSVHAKSLTLCCECEDGVFVTSDVEMLRRIVSNLLDNALKFTEQGSIGARASLLDKDRIRLTVWDTGRGLDDQDQERVFEDFAQVGNPQRDRRRGHGLGLGIVRRLARLTGIRYAVESRVGEGTRVHLDMPAAGGAEPVVGGSSHALPAMIARRVLVVDDDAAVLSAYRHALASLGCKVHAVSTVEAACAVVAKEPVEVAVVDYRLDDTDGLQTVRRLREHRPGLPAVLVSADSSPEMLAAALQLGMPCLRKPVTDASLAQAINEALHARATTPPPAKD